VRAVLVILALLLLTLQYQLWLAPDGMREVWRLQHALDSQRAENQALETRNQALAAEVADLKEGLAAIEERARNELGMVRSGETFHQIVSPPDPPASTAGDPDDG
jgi:cell division protein FtsB